MIPFTRAQARDFGALLAKCATGRPRGPGPPVQVRVRAGVRTIDAVAPSGVRLTHTTSVPGAPAVRVLFSLELLTACAGSSDEPVALEPQSKASATAHWSDAGGRRVLPVELLLPGKQQDLAELPPLAPVKPELLAALHECGRTTARDDGRFALSRVQVRGSGTVIGTDGRTALLWNGFELPFADDVLVPALSVFGAKPLASSTEVRVGRASEFIVLSVGPWAVWLPTDTKAKYPDVPAVVLRRAPTTLELDPRDADELGMALPQLPGAEHESRPVTLAVGSDSRACVRAASDGTVKSVALTRSAVRGPAVQIALDRRALLRALALGCHTVRLVARDKPVTFGTANRTFVVAALSADLVVPDTAELTPKPQTERRAPMKPDSTAPARGDPPNAPDPLDLAENLRVALAEAAATAAKLVAALRHSRKEKKALATVLTGLKQLNLTAP